MVNGVPAPHKVARALAAWCAGGAYPPSKRRLRRLTRRLYAQFNGLSSFTSSICVGASGCTTMRGRA
jgi:hypothetical protein